MPTDIEISRAAKMRPIGEIAARLGISKSMVEKHVMKALAHCRDRMRDLLD